MKEKEKMKVKKKVKMEMKVKAKIALLSGVLIISMLAACGKTPASSTTASQPATTTAAATAATTAEAATAASESSSQASAATESSTEATTAAATTAATTATTTAEATTAASEAASATTAAEPQPQYTEIRVEVFDRGTDGGRTDPTNNFYTDWIKAKVLEEFNIGVTFVAVPRPDESASLNNLMAAGSAPDVCVTYDSNLVANYRDLGGILNIAPYVDTLLIDLKEFLGPDLALPGRDFIMRNADNQTGAIYSVQAKRMNTASHNTFIRKDWLDKLGLPLPKTTEEYYNALKAFKEQDPGGVGANSVIPFTMTTDVRWRAAPLLESFVDVNFTEKDRWINTAGGVGYLFPGYKEGVRFLNKMYNEGLIDPEFPLYNDDVASNNLIKSGVVGSLIHSWDEVYRSGSPDILKDLRANVPDAEFITIDPFVNGAGVTRKSIYDAAGLHIIIPASSKNPEGALRYINWIAKFENRYFLQIGEEGVTHSMVNGIPVVKAAEGAKIMNSPLNLDYTIVVNGLDVGDPLKTAEALANSYPVVEPGVIVEAYENSMRNGRPAPVIPVVLSAEGPVSQVLSDKGKSLAVEAITAKPENFDAVWDAGIADWLASGAQAVIDERAAKYFQP